MRRFNLRWRGSQPRWRVTVDDIDMASAHTYVIEAANLPAAIVEAVRRAIMEDERGCGVDPALLTDEIRREHADSWDIVAAVGGYAVAERVS